MCVENMYVMMACNVTHIVRISGLGTVVWDCYLRRETKNFISYDPHNKDTKKEQFKT